MRQPSYFSLCQTHFLCQVLAARAGIAVERGTRQHQRIMNSLKRNDTMKLPVPLRFLGAGEWQATLWQDAPDSDQNPERLVENATTVSPSDTLQLKLAPLPPMGRGGRAGSASPLPGSLRGQGRVRSRRAAAGSTAGPLHAAARNRSLLGPPTPPDTLVFMRYGWNPLFVLDHGLQEYTR